MAGLGIYNVTRLPGLETTRSLSRYGLSQVTVIFRDGTDIYFARQLVHSLEHHAMGRARHAIEALAEMAPERRREACQASGVT